jgi:hypothetical protein
MGIFILYKCFLTPAAKNIAKFMHKTLLEENAELGYSVHPISAISNSPPT